MITNTTRINTEDLRRNLGLPPHFTVKSIVMEGNEVIVETVSPVIAGDSIKRIPGQELSKILKAIELSLSTGKEIIFSYHNEKRDTLEITSRKFLPMIWINDDCIEGFDLDKKEVRRFCPSRMDWIESVITV